MVFLFSSFCPNFQRSIITDNTDCDTNGVIFFVLHIVNEAKPLEGVLETYLPNYYIHHIRCKYIYLYIRVLQQFTLCLLTNENDR